MPFAWITIWGNFSGTPTAELFRIVDDHLHAKHVFAFGINLQSQLAAAQLEDRQIIRRFLDRDFPFVGLLPLAIFGPVPVAQNRLDRFQVQQHAAAVDQRLKHLVHMPADLENQVAAVLHLIIRVLVMKPALLLLLQLQRVTQAGGINPTLAGLTQPPYGPWSG